MEYSKDFLARKSNLESKLKQKVKDIIKDEKYQDIPGIEDGFYVKCPFLSETPKFIFIGLEPSLIAKKFIKKIDWLSTFDNFILHFCAWKACGGLYNYHFTDISKLAMRAKNANDVQNDKKVRNEIHPNFHELFEEEIAILTTNDNRPVLITTNRNWGYVKEFQKKGFSVEIALHWSQAVPETHYKKYFETNHVLVNETSEKSYEDFYGKISDFASQIMLDLEFTEDQINDRINIIFDTKDKSKYRQRRWYLYHYYLHRFEAAVKTHFDYKSVI